MNKKRVFSSGQTAVEYILLLGAIVAIVLIGFNRYLPDTLSYSNLYFNRASLGIMGKPPPCNHDYICNDTDGHETIFNCPSDCGSQPWCGDCSCNEVPQQCPNDCACNNNGTCDFGETRCSCLNDCICYKNGTCDTAVGETHSNCPADCP